MDLKIIEAPKVYLTAQLTLTKDELECLCKLARNYANTPKEIYLYNQLSSALSLVVNGP